MANTRCGSRRASVEISTAGLDPGSPPTPTRAPGAELDVRRTFRRTHLCLPNRDSIDEGVDERHEPRRRGQCGPSRVEPAPQQHDVPRANQPWLAVDRREYVV